MYRLMKSEKFAVDHAASGSMLSYRQIQVDQFRELAVALNACDAANEEAGFRHYVLNEAGEEYYEGMWIY